MVWFIASIVVVLAVFIAGFRRTAVGLLIAAIGGGFALFQYNDWKDQQAATRISASEIVLEAFEVKPTFGSSYDVRGRIKNKSETYRIDGLSFNVTMRDCQGKDASRCTTLGEAAAHVPMNVPPQETRSFTGSVYFGSQPVKPKGTLAWDHEITAIMAKRQ